MGEWDASFCTFLIPRSLLTTLLYNSLPDSSFQDLFDASIRGGREWIHLQKVLQNIPGRDIATLLAAVDGQQIVLKLQPVLQAQKERDVCKRLEQEGIKGFIHIACMLHCGPASTKLLGPSGTPPLTNLVTGSSMVAIAMEYYPNGSLEDYIKKHEPPWTTIVHILCDVVCNSYKAYTFARFCHGDLFAKNVLLDKDLKPIITDLEKARFDSSGQNFWMDMTDFFDDIIRHAPLLSRERDLQKTLRQHVLRPRAYNIQPTQQCVDALVHSLQSDT